MSSPQAPQPARYNFRETEAKWQKVWEDRQTFRARMDKARPKYYVLEMFPYPSGRIHMGHVRNYTQGDVIARYKRATRLQRAASDGLGRLRPAGRERGDGEEGPSQGLDLREHRHHEGAAQVDGPVARLEPRARDLRSQPTTATSRRCSSTSGRRGSPTASEAWVNWDPVDNTVLANEQVIEGKGWRTGATGRAPQAHPVEPQDHALRRGAARAPRHARPLAREGAPDAGQLDRQEPRRARLLAADRRRRGADSRQARDLHHAARHAVRRVVRGAVGRPSDRRRAGGEGPRPAALHRRMPQDRHRRGRDRDRGEAGLQAAAARQASADAGQDRCRSMPPTSC